jgi:DNA-binding transcriptional regulator GbsR (MarR family)
MHGLIEQLTNWYEDVKKLETERLAQLLALGSRVARLVEATEKVVLLGRRKKKD